MFKIAIITTHPIQYNAPLFKLLNERKKVSSKIFYTWGQSKSKLFDPGFGNEREWDIPLLEGYDYEFVENISRKHGSHHFKGIDNPSLIEKIKEYSPDAILIYGWNFKSHLKILTYFKNKKPIWFRGDSTLLDEPKGFSLKKIIRRQFLKWVYSHIDQALYVGKQNKEYFLKHGVKESQLKYAPHTVDINRFMDDELKKEEQAIIWRNEIGISDEMTVFLYAGKFYGLKQIDVLIHAFKKLPNSKCRLLLVGNGEQEQSLKEMSLSDSRIIFQSFKNQSEMPWVYKAGNVFVLPSSSETWGLSINEAMASSRPVIATDKCAGSYDLITNETGWIVESGNIEELSHIMNYCCENPEKIKKMGVVAKENILKYNNDIVADTIEKLAKSI